LGGFVSVASEAKRFFLSIPGVVAVSVRPDAVVVYVESEDVAKTLPRVFRGLRVEVRVIGRVEVFK
jgi:hypothetical protein